MPSNFALETSASLRTFATQKGSPLNVDTKLGRAPRGPDSEAHSSSPDEAAARRSDRRGGGAAVSIARLGRNCRSRPAQRSVGCAT